MHSIDPKPEKKCIESEYKSFKRSWDKNFQMSLHNVLEPD